MENENYNLEVKNCLSCRFAKNFQGKYCYCKKRINRKQISSVKDCSKYERLGDGVCTEKGNTTTK